MCDFLWIGTALGHAIGLLHAALVYRTRIVDERATPGRAAWFALWAVGLWTLFGAYLLLFWLIGAAGMAVSALRTRADA